MEGVMILIVLGVLIFLLFGLQRGISGNRKADEALDRIDRLQSRLHREDGDASSDQKRLNNVFQKAHSVTLVTKGLQAPLSKRVPDIVAASYAAKISSEIEKPKITRSEWVDVSKGEESLIPDAEIASEPPALPITRTYDTPEEIVSTEPDFVDVLVEKFKKQLPDTENMNWETLVWTYIVPRLGILGVSVAVFIIMTLLSSKGSPELRVAMGYVVSAAMLGAGWKFEKAYGAYARVLFAGGLAVAYFVTFATHFIPYAKIFDTPGPSLLGMGAIVAIWAFIAERRKSAVVAMLVTALGHFTIGLSTFSLDDPATYSVLGILILSVGSAFFLLRNRWYYVAAVGLVASYGNHFFLMAKTDSPDTVATFVLGMSVLAAYYLIYALAEVFAPEKLRRESVPTWFRSGLVSVNTVCLLGLGSLVMNGFSFTEDYQYLFRYAFAAVLLVIALVYLVRQGRDPLYNLYFTKASAIATLGLVDQFSGTSLTTWIAVEMVVLLVSARRSGLLVTLLLAQAVAVLAFLHGLGTISDMRSLAYSDPIYTTTLVQAALAVAGFLGASVLFQKTDWGHHIRIHGKLPYGMQVGLWNWGMVGKPEDAPEDSVRPLNGLLIPYGYALAGALMLLGYMMQLVSVDHGFLVTAITSAALLGLAFGTKSQPLGLASFLWFGVVWMTGMYDMLKLESVGLAAAAVGIAALPVLASEKRYVGERTGWTIFQAKPSAYILYGVWSMLAGLFLLGWLDAVRDTASLLALAGILYTGSRVLHGTALRLSSIGVFLWAAALWHLDYGVMHNGTVVFDDRVLIYATEFHMRVVLAALVILAVSAERLTNRDTLKQLGLLVFMVAWGSLMRVTYMQSWTELWWLMLSGIYMVYGLGVRSKAAAGLAVASLILASALQLVTGYAIFFTHGDATLDIPKFMMGTSGAAVMWFVLERLIKRAGDQLKEEFTKGMVPACVVAMTLLLLVLAERIPALSDTYLTLSWSALGVGLFGLAVATRESWYRYSALAVLGLATARVVLVDTRELEVLYRAAAWGGLGLALLGLALVYYKLFVAPDNAVIDTKVDLKEDENESEV